MEDASRADIDSALDFLIGDTQGESANLPKSLPSSNDARKPKPQREQRANPPRPRPQLQSDRIAENRPKTRMGRPPGVTSGEGRPKEKTSLSLDVELMDRYRKQTWKEECQFGELIERALRDYAARTWNWNEGNASANQPHADGNAAS